MDNSMKDSYKYVVDEHDDFYPRIPDSSYVQLVADQDVMWHAQVLATNLHVEEK